MNKRIVDVPLRVLVSSSLILGFVPTPALAEALRDPDAASAASALDATDDSLENSDTTGVTVDESANEPPSEYSGITDGSFDCDSSVLNGRSTDDFSLVCAKDLSSLSDCSISFKGYNRIAVGNSTVSSCITVDGYDGSVISPEEYTLEFSLRSNDSDEFSWSAEAPSSVGKYVVRAVANEDGSYTDSTSDANFEMVDPTDIASFEQAPSLELALAYIDAAGKEVSKELTQDVDYEIDHYLDSEGNAIDGVPTDAGSYRAVVTGIGDYHGEKELALAPQSQDDISTCHLTIISSGGSFTTASGISDSNFVLSSATGDRIEPSQYKIRYWASDGNGFRLLDSVPAGAGSYLADAIPAEGSRLTGEHSDSIGFEIKEANDLGACRVEVPYSGKFGYSGEPVNVLATVKDTDLATVDPSEYVLCYRDENHNDIDGAPTEVGYYWVYAKAKEGSKYTGITPASNFSIIDPNKISTAYFGVRGSYSLVGQAPSLTCDMHYLDSSGKYVDKHLEQGADFEIDSYQLLDSDGKPSGDPSLEPPSEAGDYRVTLRGVGDYSGIATTQVTFVTSNDLSTASIQGVDAVELRDGKIDFAGYVVDSNGDRINPSEYTFVFKDAMNGRELSGLPTAVGPYSVCAKANSGSGYVGKTSYYSFTAYDLRNLASYHSTNSVTTTLGKAPSIKLFYFLYGYLSQGSDFVIDHYEKTNGSNVGKEPPSQAGVYFAVLSPAQGSSFYGQTRVSFNAYDSNDLASCSVTIDKGMVPLTNGVTKPSLTLVSSTGRLLKEGVDYEVKLSDYDYATDVPVTEITKPGLYRASVVAIEGGAWFGTAGTFIFQVYDSSDVSDECYLGNNVPVAGDLSSFRVVISDYEAGQNSLALVLGKDFEIVEVKDSEGKTSASLPTAPGTYSVTIRGIGSYKGEKTFDNCVFCAKNSLQQYSIKSDSTYAMVKDGKLVSSFYLVDVNGNKADLKEGEDYVIEYCLNMYEGNAVWTSEPPVGASGCYIRARAIDGNGHIGESSVGNTGIAQSNDIVAASLSFGPAVEEVTYTGGMGSAYYADFTGDTIDFEPQLILDGKTLVEGIDYDLSVANADETGLATLVFRGKGSYTGKNSVSINIRVRLDGSNISVSDIEPCSYTGSEQTPDVVVKAGDKVLEPGVDYIVSYENNIDAGTATVVITGKGSNTGTKRKSFTINGISIAGAKVSVLGSQTYTGAECRPNVKVMLDGKELQAGVDYSVSYSNNVNAGTASIQVTGKGTYSGSVKASFQIAKADLSKAAVTASDQTANGSACRPSPVVKLNGKIVSSDNYDVSYRNNTAPGTATVTVTGKKNYRGSASGTFKITEATLDLSKATAKVSDQTYSGKALTPNVQVTLNGKTLRQGTDFSVSYKNNVEPGTATATVTGKGSYKGSLSVNFQIKAARQTMYRLYNPYTGEHFYTSNADEKDNCVKVGWNYEGVGWTAPSKSSHPVYRLYNPYVSGGDHHYTMSDTEYKELQKLGWRGEGIGWYSDDSEGVPLYRQYNPYATTGTHNYTTSKSENDTLVRLGWKYEGIGWYGMK